MQKISEIEKKVTDYDHDKYITTSEFNNLISKSFAARLAQANLITRTNFHTKLVRFNKNLTQIKQNMCLLKKLQVSDSSYFRDKNYFADVQIF